MGQLRRFGAAESLTSPGMAMLSRFDVHRWRTQTSATVRWIVYACAVIALLLNVGSACSGGSSSTAAGEPIKTYATLALTAFLRATNRDPGPVADFFPGIDMQTVDLPAQPDQILTVTAQNPEPNGTNTWLVPLTVATTDGATQSWKIPIAVRGTGDGARYAATRLPSPWPGLSTDKDRAATNSQVLPEDSPAAVAVSDFLCAWIGGEGEVSRYTTTAEVAPAWPKRPYTFVDVKSVRTYGAAPESVKGAVTVVADVIANRRHSRQFSYTLRLEARKGQWMVAAINPAS